MITLTGQDLDLEKLHRIAQGEPVCCSDDARQRVAASRARIERILKQGHAIYGINTGFGHLCHTRIADHDLERLQTNLVRSHATGVGEPFSREVVRAAMAIRANSLLHGVSGVRTEVIDRLLELLNRGITPYVPQQGSVGSSGDLAPLSHIVLVLLGEGELLGDDLRPVPATPALAAAGLPPLALTAKEGLALINGTSVMTAVLALALERAMVIARSADVIAALSLEVLRGSTAPFDPEFIALRPYDGMKKVATNLLACVADSEVRASHVGCEKVQDAYSLRCMPQVHGASRETFDHLVQQVTIELNSVTDNPILLGDEKIVSGGHFHGQPMALAADFFGIAAAELANISERRIDRLLNPLVSGLSPFLARDPGVNSGLMIVQYTAASLVSENKVLAHPASVDSIPTSAYQEDHVSMGTIAARKGARIIDHTAQVLAIEWICGAQAYESVKPLRLGRGTTRAYERLRQAVPALEDDRILYPELRVAKDLIWKGELLNHVAGSVHLV